MDIDEIQRRLASGKPMTPEERSEALRALGLPGGHPTKGLHPIVPPGAVQAATEASGPAASPWTCCTGCTKAFWHQSPRHGWRAYCHAMGHWSAEAVAPDEAATQCGHFEPRPGPALAIEPKRAASRPARELSAALVGRMVAAGRVLKFVPPDAFGDVLEEMGQWVPRRSEWLAALGHWAPVRTPTRRQQKIIDAGLRCQEQELEAADLGFMARIMVLATLPHSKQDGNEFTRVNGSFRLSIWSPDGLPYGSLPRLILAWITTEACRTGSRELELGASLSEFMAALGEVPTGGRWGSVTRVKRQMRRLVSSTITAAYGAGGDERGAALQVVDAYEFWWGRDPGQAAMWASHIHLGERFFNEIVDRPVPLDMRALRVLKKSPLALDIYCWLTHRMSYLQTRTVVPWAALAAQFGAAYGRPRDFRSQFNGQLRAVLSVYPANAAPIDGGLELRPTRTHVAKKTRTPVDKPCG